MDTIDYIKYLPKDNFYYLYFLICIVIIFLYARFRCLNLDIYKDPLENGIKNSSIDGWSSTHLFFYMLIGYKYPNTFILTLIFGILWELFETYIGLYEPKLFENWGFCNSKNKNLKKKWWYGKLSDPIINSIGFFIGMKINKIKN
tara:strand:+ start:1602 stop:2036 length:435 start_codon:yes stop_codon:yes gene_type:complete